MLHLKSDKNVVSYGLRSVAQNKEGIRMNSKMIWMILGSLMVAVLVLASCAPSATPTPTSSPTPTPTPTATPTSKPTVAPTPTKEEPKYGGTFVGVYPTTLTGFDDVYTYGPQVWITHLTNDELIGADWSKGSQGTGEASWLMQGTLFLDKSRGNLAESWEIADNETIVFHIRQGIRWQNKPPVNGREFNANDVVFSINRLMTTSTYFATYRPQFKSITASDKWTVVVKAVPGYVGEIFKRVAEFAKIVPPEVIEKYGGMREWQNVVGTGPFVLKDYVENSSATLIRNPDFWDKDPLHPQNRLPYLDSVKWLIITDKSTRLAAMRTGKIDWLNDVGWEEEGSLMKTNPDMKSFRYLQAAHQNVIFMRIDKPELPFKDIRVRRALAMAIDNEAIKRDYYGGNAELFSCPVAPYPEFMQNVFVPLDKMPESVREYYGYHPDKAKQLLTEAGYPNGFKTEILCYADKIDLLAIVKGYWAKVGVDLTLDVREYTVWNSIRNARSHKEMVISLVGTVAPFVFQAYASDSYMNLSMINDPRVQATRDVVRQNEVINDAKCYQVLKELFPYILEQCWMIETPSPYLNTMWQPWIKGYGGEWTVGYSNAYNFPRFIWCDQALKESMASRR